GRISSVIARVLNVKEMLVFNEVQKLIDADDDLAKEDLVATICDNVLPETAVQPQNPGAILFLTMHGSKGLTKKTVVIPGLEQAWLPGNATGIVLSERKRLFYVAITRATDNLVLTFP